MKLTKAEPNGNPLVLEESAPADYGTSPARTGMSDSRVHVLFLIDGVFAMGGGEGALLKIVRYLPRDRFRCSLAVFKPGPLYDLFRNADCPVHIFPISTAFSPASFKAALQLHAFLRQQAVSIVHTFFESANLWGALIAKLGRGPLVVSSRRDMGFLRSLKHRVAYRLLHPLFDSVVAVSKPVRDLCIKDEGIAPERVITLYNGVDFDELDVGDTGSIRSTLGLSGASHVIVSVGNIRRVKGFDILIRAAAKVCREYPTAVFVIVGGLYEVEHVEELKRLAESLRVSGNIRFAGALNEVPAALRASDVFCLLSRTEGFSNALVEAMASGLPAVATRVGGAEETITNGKDGFLVDSEDVDAAAERILILLQDKEMAQRIGAAARETVRTRFTAQIMCNTLADHYDGLLQRHHSSKRQSPAYESAKSVSGTRDEDKSLR